jgi:hypothetical protein
MNKKIFILGIVTLITYTIALLTDTVILAYALPVIYMLGVYS